MADMPKVAPPNPPTPHNVIPLPQSKVTKQIGAWATSLLNHPTEYPMFSQTKKEFGYVTVMARIEWHTWTHRAGKLVHGVYRGVTLYEVLSGPPSADDSSTFDP